MRIQRARWKPFTEGYLVEHEVINDELRMKKIDKICSDSFRIVSA